MKAEWIEHKGVLILTPQTSRLYGFTDDFMVGVKQVPSLTNFLIILQMEHCRVRTTGWLLQLKMLINKLPDEFKGCFIVSADSRFHMIFNVLTEVNPVLTNGIHLVSHFSDTPDRLKTQVMEAVLSTSSHA